MVNLTCYKTKLYGRAKSLSTIRNGLLIMELGILILLLFRDTYIYETLLIVAIIHIYVEVLKYLIKRSNMLAFKFDKIIRLKKSYGTIPSDFELADLKSESLSFYKKLKKCLNEKEEKSNDYNIKDKSSPEKLLLSMLQEDAFWNHHQFYHMFLLKRKYLLYWTVPILTLIFIFPLFSDLLIIKETLSSIQEEPLKMILIFLSFGLLYEIIEEMLNYYRASIEMKELDNEITRIYENNESINSAISLMVKFHFVRAMCPYIDDNIYKKYGYGLNKAWDLRVMSSIYNVLKILVKELTDIDEKWAITGGANLYLRKCKNTTSDIDIITTEKGVIEIARKFNIKIQKENFKKKEIEDLRSYFILHKINGINIDIMGDPEYKVHNKWKLLKWKDKVVSSTIDNKTINTTSLSYERYTQTIISNQKIDRLTKQC